MIHASNGAIQLLLKSGCRKSQRTQRYVNERNQPPHRKQIPNANPRTQLSEARQPASVHFTRKTTFKSTGLGNGLTSRYVEVFRKTTETSVCEGFQTEGNGVVHRRRNEQHPDFSVLVVLDTVVSNFRTWGSS